MPSPPSCATRTLAQDQVLFVAGLEDDRLAELQFVLGERAGLV